MNEPTVTTTPHGLATSVNIDQPIATDPPNAKPFLDSLPEAYRDKQWAVNFSKADNPLEAFAQSYDSQMALIGKKAEGLRVPGETATPEDWQSFYRSIGVPESSDKYEYKAPEVSEALKPYFATDEKLLSTMKEAALKAGVRPEGFKHLTEAFDNFYMGELETHVTKTKETLAKLENDFKTKFGDRSDQVLDTFQKSIAGLGEAQTALINALDPSVKVVLAEHFENFAKKYVREDSLNLTVPTSAQGAMNEKDYGDAYEKAFAAVRSAKTAEERVVAERKLAELKKRGISK
jgi:hypothetical protein